MPYLHFSFCAGENSRPLVFQSASATMRSMRCFEFESRHSDQKRRKSICSFVFFLSAERFESLNATVRWTVARDGWTERNYHFASGENANESRHSKSSSSNPDKLNPERTAVLSGFVSYLHFLRTTAVLLGR